MFKNLAKIILLSLVVLAGVWLLKGESSSPGLSFVGGIENTAAPTHDPASGNPIEVVKKGSGSSEIVAIQDGPNQYPLTYTDENEAETIIIKTDKELYVGFSSVEAYVSTKNLTATDEKIDLQLLFGNPKVRVESVELLEDKQWKRMKITSDKLVIADTWPGKRKQIESDVESKARIRYALKAGETAYFRLVFSFDPIEGGEFWFEAFGEKGAYGLLDPWYNSSWLYRRKITIDSSMVSGGSALTNFPALVSISHDDFKFTSFGGKVASSSGGDLLFTDSGGSTMLDFEIEHYASTSGHILAWVEIPTLAAATDTDIYLYYGGPTNQNNQDAPGTWNTTYEGVWHLKDDPAPITGNRCGIADMEICDSLDTNDGDAITIDSSALVNGKIYNALDFDGLSDYITMGDVLNEDGDQAFSLSAWHNTNDLSGGIISKTTTLSDGYNLRLTTVPGLRFDIGIDTTTRCSYETGTSVRGNVWYYLVATYSPGASCDSSRVQIYINGILHTSGTYSGSGFSTGSSNTNGFDLSQDGIVGGGNTGITDEVRKANTALSADWIKTEYNNQSDPEAYLTVAAEEAAPAAPDPSLPRVKVRGGVKVKGGVDFR